MLTLLYTKCLIPHWPIYIWYICSVKLITSCNCNCNCNWGTCIAPPTRRPRAHRVNSYLGARRQNETKMFSDHDETSPSIAAVLAPSLACSVLVVQQQERLCRQFVDVSAARRSCHTMNAQCRSTWNIGNRWQKVCDILTYLLTYLATSGISGLLDYSIRCFTEYSGSKIARFAHL